jgi:hypothetical protein
LATEGEERARERARRREYYLKNREKCAAWWARYYKKNRRAVLDGVKARRKRDPDCRSSTRGDLDRRRANMATNLINNARKRSAKLNRPCKIDRGWVAERLRWGKCELTGIPFRYDPGSPYRPSLDRIDSSKPYVHGNVRVVLVFINWAKHSYEDAVFQDVLQDVANALRKKGSGVS